MLEFVHRAQAVQRDSTETVVLEAQAQVNVSPAKIAKSLSTKDSSKTSEGRGRHNALRVQCAEEGIKMAADTRLHGAQSSETLFAKRVLHACPAFESDALNTLKELAPPC